VNETAKMPDILRGQPVWRRGRESGDSAAAQDAGQRCTV